jgi:membrane dipeptidase
MTIINSCYAAEKSVFDLSSRFGLKKQRLQALLRQEAIQAEGLGAKTPALTTTSNRPVYGIKRKVKFSAAQHELLKTGESYASKINLSIHKFTFFYYVGSSDRAGPKAVNDALERIAAVHKLAADRPDKVMLCTTAADVQRAHKEGKIAALMGMEGGHMINNSLPVLRMYAALGVRYLTLAHSVNTDWADSSGDQPKHNGLTEFGKDVVRELNKLGVMVDISHVADKTFWDALEVSKAPLIASHSSCRAISGHARNMTDEMI